MSSFIDSNVNELFLKCLNKMHGTYGEVHSTCDKGHEYLGMNIDSSYTGKVKIDMVDYIGNMIDECTKNITGTAPTPATEDLFSCGKYEPLPNYKAAEFHTIISKAYLHVRALGMISILSLHISVPMYIRPQLTIGKI